MPGRTEFDFRFGGRARGPAPRGGSEGPMRILVMGDFSGRANRNLQNHADLAGRTPYSVDLDDFDRVMSRLSPSLELPTGPPGGAVLTVEFQQLEDFHPDALYRRLPIFRALRETRQRMQNPATFAEAAAEFRSEAQRRVVQPEGEPPARPRNDEQDTDTFARLLGGAPASPRAGVSKPAQQVDINAFIRNLVAPHIVPDAPPFQAQYVSSVDAATSEQMRRVLHDPEFQALEALWRGVHWLVSNLELGEELKLYVLDVSKGELLADLRAQQGDLEIVWASSAARRAGGAHDRRRAVVASSWPAMNSVSKAWTSGCSRVSGRSRHTREDLSSPRRSRRHRRIRLAAPPCRIRATGRPPKLRHSRAGASCARACWHPGSASCCPACCCACRTARRPSGSRNSISTSSASLREHESYLWGNGALACALLLGRSFLSRGWEDGAGRRARRGGPACSYVHRRRRKAPAAVRRSEPQRSRGPGATRARPDSARELQESQRRTCDALSVDRASRATAVGAVGMIRLVTCQGACT